MHAFTHVCLWFDVFLIFAGTDIPVGHGTDIPVGIMHDLGPTSARGRHYYEVVCWGAVFVVGALAYWRSSDDAKHAASIEYAELARIQLKEIFI